MKNLKQKIKEACVKGAKKIAMPFLYIGVSGFMVASVPLSISTQGKINRSNEVPTKYLMAAYSEGGWADERIAHVNKDKFPDFVIKDKFGDKYVRYGNEDGSLGEYNLLERAN